MSPTPIERPVLLGKLRAPSTVEPNLAPFLRGGGSRRRVEGNFGARGAGGLGVGEGCCEKKGGGGEGESGPHGMLADGRRRGNEGRRAEGGGERKGKKERVKGRKGREVSRTTQYSPPTTMYEDSLVRVTVDLRSSSGFPQAAIQRVAEFEARHRAIPLLICIIPTH